MASLINSPKHIKKDQYQLHRLFKKTEEKEILSIFYDMETKPRKENKTAINTPAWQGDCSSSGGLGLADLWDGGKGGGKRKWWNLVRRISLEPFCETALWEKMREYQKWRSQVIRRQMVLWLWNNKWVRTEATGYPGRSALGAPVRAVYFLTTCRPGLSGSYLFDACQAC